MVNQKRKSSRKKRSNNRIPLMNTTIVLLSVICLGFLFSIIQRSWRGSIRINQDRRNISPPQLITTSYEESPFSSIEVEVLNGCGVKNLAQHFTDYLRTRHIDVVNTENANHFNYPRTHIIQRSQFFEGSYRVAELLNIPKSDTTRILLKPNLSLDHDVTLVIGQDYNTIKPFRDFLKTQPLY
ncbi:MAG: LytR C-terminal domain-containing protein [Candidatus Marinimicrobia bacterium]|nr:LytR C-terminal domain-containing protein [Candidatus Neomarinimicrobiota bacterium]